MGSLRPIWAVCVKLCKSARVGACASALVRALVPAHACVGACIYANTPAIAHAAVHGVCMRVRVGNALCAKPCVPVFNAGMSSHVCARECTHVRNRGCTRTCGIAGVRVCICPCTCSCKAHSRQRVPCACMCKSAPGHVRAHVYS
eukprot:500386-Pleurochrysis_carterae.AAC.1